MWGGGGGTGFIRSDYKSELSAVIGGGMGVQSSSNLVEFSLFTFPSLSLSLSLSLLFCPFDLETPSPCYATACTFE